MVSPCLSHAREIAGVQDRERRLECHGPLRRHRPRDRNRPTSPPVLSARIRALIFGGRLLPAPFSRRSATPRLTSHQVRSRLPSPPLLPTTTPRGPAPASLPRWGTPSPPPPMERSRSGRTGTEASIPAWATPCRIALPTVAEAETRANLLLTPSRASSTANN